MNTCTVENRLSGLAGTGGRLDQKNRIIEYNENKTSCHI